MASNKLLKVIAVLAVFSLGIILFVVQLSGKGGWIVGLALAAIANGIVWWQSDTVALRMSQAKLTSPEDAPELHAMIEDLAARAGIPTPAVHIIESSAPNAFATGRTPSHGAIAITAGLIDTLRPAELEAVLAHEVAHIKNHDTLLASIIATIAGAVATLAEGAKWMLLHGSLTRPDGNKVYAILGILGSIVMVILAPIIALMTKVAVSRDSEYQADAVAAHLLGDPSSLADALALLEHNTKRISKSQLITATSHLFIIPTPDTSFLNIFRTHPPTASRIARLRSMRLDT